MHRDEALCFERVVLNFATSLWPRSSVLPGLATRFRRRSKREKASLGQAAGPIVANNVLSSRQPFLQIRR